MFLTLSNLLNVKQNKKEIIEIYHEDLKVFDGVINFMYDFNIWNKIKSKTSVNLDMSKSQI